MVSIKKKEVKSKTGSWLETYLAKRSPEPKKWRYSAEIADMVDKKGVQDREVRMILDRIKDKPEMKNVMMWLTPWNQEKVEKALEELRKKKE